MTATPQLWYDLKVKRKSVERKPGMRKRSRSQLEAELAAAIVRGIELRIRSAKRAANETYTGTGSP